jgi:hypothetical protein
MAFSIPRSLNKVPKTTTLKSPNYTRSYVFFEHNYYTDAEVLRNEQELRTKAGAGAPSYPKFDMAPLLGGTDAVFLSLIHAFSWSVRFFLCLGFILCRINVWKHSLGIPSNGWTGIRRHFFMHIHASLSRNQQGRQLVQFCRTLLIQGFYLHC